MFDYERYGFKCGGKSELGKILENKLNLKSVHIDTYIASPYIFLLRSAENKVTAAIENDRVVIRRNDRNNTTISNVPFDVVEDVRFKFMEDCRFQAFFTIFNICYRIIAEVC